MNLFKFLLFGILTFFISISIGQESPFKFKGALGFAQGFITENTRTQQVHGFIGGYYKKFEGRFDAFYYLGASGDRPRFLKNDQIYFGVFYHFLEGNLKPYVGFQTGLANAQGSEYGTFDSQTGETTFEKLISPVQTFVGGAKYKAESPLFVFLETRYILGQHKSQVYPVYLDELRVSVGLGFEF